MLAWGNFKGKQQLLSCQTIPLYYLASVCRTLLAIFMKGGKGSDINQHNGAGTTQDLPGMIVNE